MKLVHKQTEDASSQVSTPSKKEAKRHNAVHGVAGDARRRRRALPEIKEEVDEIDAAKDERTEYEKMREANMDRNKFILEALELPSVPVPAKDEAGMVSVRARGLKATRKQEEVSLTRDLSLRVQGEKPDGQQLELPPDWREPIRSNPSSRKEAGGGCYQE